MWFRSHTKCTCVVKRHKLWRVDNFNQGFGNQAIRSIIGFSVCIGFSHSSDMYFCWGLKLLKSDLRFVEIAYIPYNRRRSHNFSRRKECSKSRKKSCFFRSMYLHLEFDRKHAHLHRLSLTVNPYICVP